MGCTSFLGEEGLRSCGEGKGYPCAGCVGARNMEPGVSPLTGSQTQILPGKWKRARGQRPRGVGAAVPWEESCTSFPSWARTSRSGAPSASRSGTWSKGLRMEAFLPRLLGRFHRVCPETKHMSHGAGSTSPSNIAWLLLGNGNACQQEAEGRCHVSTTAEHADVHV